MKTNDWVRVRSRDEIEATLDKENRLKGCLFLKEMGDYCDTYQRVLKPVEQFLDERTYFVRKVSGIVLLEEAICKGTEIPDGCDHSCYFFWREEWFEKIE